MQYWNKPERMDKAETQALLKPDTDLKNQRHRQALRQGTENEQTRDTGSITLGLTRDTYSIKTRHILYTPETHVVMF